MKHVLAALFAVFIFVFTIPSTTHATTQVDPQLEIQQLLDTRAQAIRQHNKQMFMSTLEKSASDDFRERQSKSFDGWTSLLLGEYQLILRTEDSGNLAPGLQLAKSHKADDAFMAETRQVYSFDEFDDRIAFNSQWLTYVKRDDSWYVTADDDGEIIGLTSDREIWDGGPLQSQKTEHFMVLTKPDQAARGKALTEIAEQGMQKFNSRWPNKWNNRLVIIAPQSQEEMRKVLRKTHVENFSALTVYTPYRDGDSWKTTAPRLYVQDENLSTTPLERQIQTFVHELAHVASADLSGPFTPIWQQEGLAEWIRLGRPNDFDLPDINEPVSLPTTDDFATESAEKLNSAYKTSTAITTYLAKKNGQTTPFDLFTYLGSKRTEIGTPDYLINEAFMQVTGNSVDAFVRTWSGS